MQMHHQRDEQHKDNNLQYQPRADDILAPTRLAGGLARAEDGPGELAAQTDEVDEDEELGQPARGDEGVMLGFQGADDAAQGHVQRGGDEGRRGEDEEALEDKGEDGVGVVVGGGAEVVGSCFGCTQS